MKTLADAAAHALTSHYAHTKSELRAAQVLQWWLDTMGPSMPLSVLTTSAVRAALAPQSWGPSTRRRYVAFLGKTLRLAQEAGGPPPPRLPCYPAGSPRTLALTSDQTQAILDALAPQDALCQALATFLSEMGCRLGEGLNAVRRPHTASGAEAGFLATKNGGDRWLPMTPLALEAWGPGDSPVWHGLPRSTFYAAWRRAASEAGVPEATPHTLRHSWITRAAERGVPLPVIQKIVGHRSIEQTMRYIHVTGDAVRDALGA